MTTTALIFTNLNLIWQLFCKELLYWILWISKKQFICWY